MKDYILGIVLAAVLMFSFSETEFTPTGRSGTQLPGESEVVLPSGGAEPVEVVAFQAKEDVKNESHDIESKEAKQEIPVKIIVEEEKEQKSMNDMLLMFWHGVAAVLIGETSILVAAIIWLKIRLSMERKDS